MLRILYCQTATDIDRLECLGTSLLESGIDMSYLPQCLLEWVDLIHLRTDMKMDHRKMRCQPFLFEDIIGLQQLCRA